MKLRIKGNALRLRLLKSEVERFEHAGVVTDEIRFGDKVFGGTLFVAASKPYNHAARQSLDSWPHSLPPICHSSFPAIVVC